MHHHRSIITVMSLSLGLAAVGCSSDGATTATLAPPASQVATTAVPATTPATEAPASSAAASTPAGSATLTISEFAFSALTVPAGTAISITNKDGFKHTVTDKDGAFDVSVAGGATESLTIDTAGTYSIVCKIHPSMSGTITVTG